MAPPSITKLEQETRQEIDNKLEAAGWVIQNTTLPSKKEWPPSRNWKSDKIEWVTKTPIFTKDDHYGSIVDDVRELSAIKPMSFNWMSLHG